MSQELCSEPTIVRQCWICLVETAAEVAEASENNSQQQREDSWISPCLCNGSTKWVHHDCLHFWVFKSRRFNFDETIACPQCLQSYKITTFKINPFFALFEKYLNFLEEFQPVFFTATALVSITWVSFVFGSLTIFQIYGKLHGLYILYNMSPIMLFTAVPLIPVMLILMKYNNFDCFFDKFFYRLSIRMCKIENASESSLFENEKKLWRLQREQNVSSVIFAALTYPTVSIICGKMYDSLTNSPSIKVFCGAITFLLAKSLASVVHKRLLVRYFTKTRILNFAEP